VLAFDFWRSLRFGLALWVDDLRVRVKGASGG
jgi:hypothetical protein